MIEIYLLEQLDAFARLGSLSRAAEELHLSQPALTRSMKKLEETAGVPLFHRDARRLSLNQTGELAARYAARILEEEREMASQLVQADRALHSIVLGSCAPMPVNRLMPLLQVQFPDRTIMTRTIADENALLKGLHDETLDLAVLTAPPKDPALFHQRYLREKLFLYVTPDHPLAKKSSVTLEDLASCRILVNRHIGFWLARCRALLPAQNLLIQESMDAMDELADSSTIAMFNSDAMMQDGFLSQGRIAIPIGDPSMEAVYYVACTAQKKDRFRSFFSAVRAESLQQEG